MIIKALALAGAILLSSCVSVQKGLYPANKGDSGNRFVYVIYHSNHTGIALNMDEASPSLASIRQQFPGVTYLKFSWGDRSWYGGGARNAITSAGALIAPSKSALRISTLSTQPLEKTRGSRKVNSLELSRQGYEELLKFIESSFALDSNSQPVKIHSGVTQNGEFKVYAAQGQYHMFQNSNSWSSRALATAGVNLSMLQLVAGDIQL